VFVDLAHEKFQRAELGVFTKRFTDDCMGHRCAMHATGSEKLDACCQHGCDVDLWEQHAILSHADDIRRVLRADAPARWFHDEQEVDADARSGAYVRTVVHDGGCVFLAHDRRGCAIHRAGLERGWDFRVVKPGVCQLFPLTFTSDAIVISDDFDDYSCGHLTSAPTLYRVARASLGHVLGESLVAAMDAAEAAVTPRALPVVY